MVKTSPSHGEDPRSESGWAHQKNQNKNSFILFYIMITKEIIILGDIELGGGTLTDDFTADNILCKLITKFGKSKSHVDLILNGDTMDFLKCPYIDEFMRKSYTSNITLTVAETKFDLIYKSHTKVFDALKAFVQDKKNRLFFIFGNHDYEFHFAEIQNKIKKLLEEKKNVHFQMNYFEHRVYVEHGQQYDPSAEVNITKIFRKHKDEIELNIPILLSKFTEHFMPIKENHPLLERIDRTDPLFNMHKQIKVIMYWAFMKYFAYNLFFYFYKFIYRGHFLNYLKNIWRAITSVFSAEETNISPYFSPAIKKHKDAKVMVFGHLHEKTIDTINNKLVFTLDTWRDEYSLNKKFGVLIPKTKRYLEIKVEDKELEIQTVDLAPKCGKLNFKAAVKNEIEFIKKIKEKQGKWKMGRYNIIREVICKIC